LSALKIWTTSELNSKTVKLEPYRPFMSSPKMLRIPTYLKIKKLELCWNPLMKKMSPPVSQNGFRFTTKTMDVTSNSLLTSLPKALNFWRDSQDSVDFWDTKLNLSICLAKHRSTKRKKMTLFDIYIYMIINPLSTSQLWWKKCKLEYNWCK
jgi:hypothetical protein